MRPSFWPGDPEAMRKPTFVLTALVFTALAVAPADAGTLTCAGRPVTVRIGAGQHPTDGDDVIWGTPGDDLIRAGMGTDHVCARGGADRVFGGKGADRIFGQAGDDSLNGRAGNDRLFGGIGGDFTAGNGGIDHCDLGPPDPGNEGDPTCETGSGA